MREIKFRGWHPSSKIMSVPFTLMDALEHEVDKTSDDEIHLQFTGLLDNQGIEIYEGDILHNSFGDENYKVIFRDCSFILYSNEFFIYPNSLSLQLQENDIEVIGNIYENPELLEEINEPTT